MLPHDLKAAGIDSGDGEKRDIGRGRENAETKERREQVVDFHALRHSYITNVFRKGVNPKVVPKLARHSTITLTLDRDSHVDEGDIRGALEGDG